MEAILYHKRINGITLPCAETIPCTGHPLPRHALLALLARKPSGTLGRGGAGRGRVPVAPVGLGPTRTQRQVAAQVSIIKEKILKSTAQSSSPCPRSTPATGHFLSPLCRGDTNRMNHGHPGLAPTPPHYPITRAGRSHNQARRDATWIRTQPTL